MRCVTLVLMGTALAVVMSGCSAIAIPPPPESQQPAPSPQPQAEPQPQPAPQPEPQPAPPAEPQPQVEPPPAPEPQPALAQPPPPEPAAEAAVDVYWQVDLALDPGERVDRLRLVGDQLYCLTTHNRLMALDAAKGLWRWTLDVAEPGYRVFDPIHLDAVEFPGWLSTAPPDRPDLEVTVQPQPFDAVLINSLTKVLVVNRASGEVAMKIPLDFAASTGLAVEKAPSGRYLLYVGSADGKLHAMDLAKALEIWNSAVGEAISSTPAVHGGVLFTAGENGILVAGVTERNDPNRLWSSDQVDAQPMFGAVSADLVVDERGCFVACQDQRLYAFDRQTGKALWPAFVCQGPLMQAPQAGENTLFQLAVRDKLYAIDAATGTQRWAMPTGRMVLAVVRDRGSHVYVLDAARSLRIVDELSGESVASAPLSDYEVFCPNATAPAAYAASRAGRVACIRPPAAGRLRPEMLRAPQP